MPRYAANLSLMYTEHAFLDRFAAAAEDGFAAVEFLFPYGHATAELAARIADAGVCPVLFNAPPGDFEAGDRGLACLPSRRDEFRRGLLVRALPLAATLACPRIHIMAGIPAPGSDRLAAREAYLDNLAWAADQAAPHGIELTIEPINPRDMPGYLLQRQDDAHRIVEQLGRPNLKVQMDLYHCQIVEGDVATKLRHYLPTGRVGHLQIAGVPARQEPDEGELNLPWLMSVVDELGWAGHVGCEYRPRAGTSAGLGWLPRRQR